MKLLACDRCGSTIEKNKQWMRLTITVGLVPRRYAGGEIDLCIDCRDWFLMNLDET